MLTTALVSGQPSRAGTAMRLIRGFAPGMACGFIIAVAPAIAQQWTPPNTPKPEQRLDSPEYLFNATVEDEPTDNTVERGRLVAMGGSAQGGAAMACFTCHGANGAGDGSGAVPRLAGLPAWYMNKQLTDYAEGRRSNTAMTGISKKLTGEEREAVSSYYALVDAPMPRLEDVDGRTLQWGQQLAAVGSTDKAIPACVNCHGVNGSGLPPSVPYLAGQYAEYITLQLQLWRDGERNNDPMNVMRAIAVKMSDHDMRAIGKYYERVRQGDDVVAQGRAPHSMSASRGNRVTGVPATRAGTAAPRVGG